MSSAFILTTTLKVEKTLPQKPWKLHTTGCHNTEAQNINFHFVRISDSQVLNLADRSFNVISIFGNINCQMLG
jgi:hypothetical protein